jgi:hypothetical protein
MDHLEENLGAINVQLTPAPKPGRQRGSARFRTYYKVQVFNERNACWDDIQRAYGTAEAARRLPAGRAVPGHGSNA